MNDDLVTEARNAVAAVRQMGVDPDSFGGGTLLKFLIGGTPPLSTSVPAVQPASGSEEPDDTPRGRVASWAGLDPDQLDDLIEFDGADARLAVAPSRLPSVKSDKQRVLGLMTIALHRVGFDLDVVPARHVNTVCTEYDCMDQNLPNRLTSTGTVTRRGKRGAFAYRISRPGLDAAKQLFVEFASGTGVVEP
jgi:hypothetical protein